MQNNEHKIDELFRSKLDGVEITPPPAAWDRISASMENTRRKHRAIWVWSMSGAAALVLAFLSGWFFSLNNVVDDELFAQIDQIQIQNRNRVLFEDEIVQKIDIKLYHNRLNNIALVDMPVTDKVIEQRSESFNLLNSLIDKPLSYAVVFPQLEEIKNKDEIFTAADKAIIEANLLAMNNTDEKENDLSGWELGMQASPVYRFDGASTEGDVFNQPITNYQPNMAGGISVGYNANDKLSFISGVNYNAVVISGKDIALSYAGHNWLSDRFYGSNTDWSAVENTDEVKTDNSTTNNLALNTQIGLANIELPEGVRLASAKVNSVAPEMVQNHDFEQQAQYVEIPMLFRYKILDKRFGVHVLAGVNTNVLVYNNSQFSIDGNVIAEPKVDDLRPLSFSSSLGMGVNYEISDRINFSLEPTLKVQLNSLNTQEYVHARPYAFGVFSGVAYRF